MIIRLFLTGLLLLPFSILANEQEKLIVVPADNVPSGVKSAAQAIGTVGSSIGFFIAKDVFIANIQGWSTSVAVNQTHNITLFRRATAEQIKMLSNSIGAKDSVAVSAGQAELIRGKYAWGVFKVTSNGEKNAFTVEPENFLKFSEFRKGDKVFILNPYHYNHSDSEGDAPYKKNLIMKVSNSDIQNIGGTEINWKESPLLDALRLNFHRSIAVNQNGEIIGLIEGTRSRLVPFDSGMLDFFSETTQKIQESENRITQPQETEVTKPPVAKKKKPKGIFNRCAAVFKTKK